jgi:hypothetical protein
MSISGTMQAAARAAGNTIFSLLFFFLPSSNFLLTPKIPVLLSECMYPAFVFSLSRIVAYSAAYCIINSPFIPVPAATGAFSRPFLRRLLSHGDHLSTNRPVRSDCVFRAPVI